MIRQPFRCWNSLIPIAHSNHRVITWFRRVQSIIIVSYSNRAPMGNNSWESAAVSFGFSDPRPRRRCPTDRGARGNLVAVVQHRQNLAITNCTGSPIIDGRSRSNYPTGVIKANSHSWLQRIGKDNIRDTTQSHLEHQNDPSRCPFLETGLDRHSTAGMARDRFISDSGGIMGYGRHL